MAEKKFEEAMKEIETLVAKMGDKNLPLEETIKAYEEGMKLINFCEKKLKDAELKIKTFEKKPKSSDVSYKNPFTETKVDESDLENISF